MQVKLLKSTPKTLDEAINRAISFSVLIEVSKSTADSVVKSNGKLGNDSECTAVPVTNSFVKLGGDSKTDDKMSQN